MSSQENFNPFPGLRPFQIEEKFLFFGREEQTSELLTRLRKTRFLAVVGVSGSGKSSLVRAGLLPELHGGTMTTAGSSWEVAVMRPGGDPLTNLAEALIEADIHNTDEEHIASHVRTTLGRSGKGLVEAIKQGDLPERTNLLLVVDQFEEIFRFRRMSGLSEEEAGHFITLLLEASEQADCPIYVVLTMRSDFLGDCAQFRGLAEAVNEGEYLIPRLNRNQRRQAIEGPVAVGSREISNRLTQRLLNDIGDDPDQLPILQHALMRTWDYWEASGAQGSLDLEHYQATGGMTEALSRHADEVHDELPDDEHRWIGEKLFKALTERVDQNRGIRRPMQMLELCNIIERDENKIRTVVDSFRAKGRTFLMPSGDSDINPKTVIDISHESLMRVWHTLRKWVDDEAQSAKIYRRLADTSSLYQDGKAGLYRNPDLQIALSWREETQPNKTWANHYFAGFNEAMSFLDKSQEEAEREEREREEARQRELAQAQALAKAQEERAETEELRAEEQARSASRLRKMLAGLAVATFAALIFLVIAVIAKGAAEEAKREVDNKILELAERSIARGDELSRGGANLRALPWYADAAKLASSDKALQNEYRDNLIQNINQAPHLTSLLFSEHKISRAGFSPNGKHFFIAERAGWNSPSKVQIYDSKNGELIHNINLPAGVNAVEITSDGNLLIIQNGQHDVSVFNFETGKLVHNIDKHTGGLGNVIALSNKQLMAVPIKGSPNGVALWNIETGGEKHSMLVTDYPCHAVSFSHDGRFLAGATGGNWWGSGNNGSIHIWELFDDRKPEIRHHINIGRPVHTVAFNPNNYDFAIGCGSIDNMHSVFFAQIYNANSAKPITEKMEHSGAVFMVEFNLSGEQLLTTSKDGTARSWNATTGKPISPPLVHAGELNYATFSPDGALIGTASSDNSARIWNAMTGLPITPHLQHIQRVNTIEFNSECNKVITSSDDGTARVFSLPIGEGYLPYRIIEDKIKLSTLDKLSDLISANKISPEGSLKKLTKKELKDNWDYLKTYNIFELKEGHSKAWHNIRAKQMHSENNWNAFFYHLNRMSTDDKQKSDNIIREADANASIENWDKSLELYLKLIDEYNINDKILISKCLSLYANMGNWEECHKLLSGLLGDTIKDQFLFSELAFEATINPKLFVDISTPINWVDELYKDRPGYIDLGNSVDIQLTDAITIEGWFYHKSKGGLLSKGGAFEDDGFGFTIGFMDGAFRFELQNTALKEKTMIDALFPEKSEWLHLAATWDKETSEMILYIDGKKQPTTGHFKGPIGISNQKLNLGRNERVGNRYCNSSFSEIRLWSKAKTADEIREAMNIRLKGNEPGLVGYWPFNKESGSIALSGIPGKANGSIINPIWHTTDALPFAKESTYCEVSKGELNLWQILTLQGGLQYRNGNIELAAKTLESARIGGARRPAHMLNSDEGDHVQWLLLAQCYYQLGEKNKAADLLSLANERVTDSFLQLRNWQERLRLQSLLAETRKMLSQ